MLRLIFEMKNKVQIDARVKGQSWKTWWFDLNVHEHEGDSRFIDLLTRLSSTEPVVVVFRMNFKWNFKPLKSKSIFVHVLWKSHIFLFVSFFMKKKKKKSLNYIRCVMLQNQWPQFVQTAMESRTFLIFNVFDRWWSRMINRILHSWSFDMKFRKLVVLLCRHF